jgi:pilus assembly protein FimV
MEDLAPPTTIGEVDFSLGDLSAKPLDMAPPPAAPAALEIPDLPAFDVPEAAAAPAVPAAMDFDLSAISLDLNPAESKPLSNGAIPPAAAPAPAADPVSNAAEMATKLDLALAYQEIGDKEGARELLDEVVKGGNSEQTEKAKAMLQKMA